MSKSVKAGITLEVWDTRFGVSIRVVQRNTDGKFIDHLSIKQLAQVQKHLENQNIHDVRKVLNAHR